MRLQSLRPMLWTEDMDATIRFYVEKLGFECHERNDEWGWASLGVGDVWIMLALPNAHADFDKIGFTGSFYFTVDDADAWWKKLKDSSNVCYSIENFDHGMREFAIYDNNGYLLQFGHEIAEKE